jgi:hypothetical protein
LLPFWSIGHPWNTLFQFSFLILRQSVGLLWWGISLSQAITYTNRINADRHLCFEWDLKDCSCLRPRPLWSAITRLNFEI